MNPAQDPQIRRVISGGQTGVDRGALDAAIETGIQHGGWCPRGRLAEDGKIPVCYQLDETESTEYPVRTERNVIDSDGTLILVRGEVQGGTQLTRRLAKKHGKPLLLLDLTGEPAYADARCWIAQHAIQVLNVAGPRESSAGGISRQARDVMIQMLSTGNSSRNC
jgi:hypothetical protein